MVCFTEFPSLEPETARLCNEILAPGRYRESFFDGRSLVFQTHVAPKPEIPEHSLHLLVGGVPAVLDLNLAPGGVWKSKVRDEWSRVAEPFRTALLAAACEELVKFLEQAFASEMEVASDKTGEQLPFSLPWRITDSEDTLHAAGVLRCGASLGEKLVARISQWPRRYFLKPEEVTLEGRMVMASTTIAITELKKLAVGDVVLLDGGKSLDLKLGRLLFSGGFSVPMQFSDDQSLLRPFHHSSTMPSSTATDSSAPEASWAQDIEVEMQFIAGTHKLSVKELMALAPGQVIDLGQPPQAPLSISVNGRRIGWGHLVKVGDQLGVQVSEIQGDVA